jgi:undecaprenyl phosphate N,N'-diacetylbacillosamine 1-phosphate transferase
MYKYFFKRIIDLIMAVIGLIILSPIFLVITVILFIIDGSPFYFQIRPGKNEKEFKIIKFKSMSDKRDCNNKLLPDSDRTTKTGAFIRKYSLDEIPQLINVVKGEMSLIGPRPLRVQYLPYYTNKEKIRHSVKPGITGLAQVSGRNLLNWDEKLSIDIEYVKNISFLLDLTIFFKTLKKIVNTSDINPTENIIDLNDYRTIKLDDVQNN